MTGCSDQDTATTNDENVVKSKIPTLEEGWKEIGYIKDGMPILTIDKKLVMQTLSENLKKLSDIEASFKDVYVVSIDDGYNLLFEGNVYMTSFYAKAVKSLKGGSTLIVKAGLSCTTSDCSSETRGCIVMYDQEDLDLPYCSPCANGGKCTKTSSTPIEAPGGLF